MVPSRAATFLVTLAISLHPAFAQTPAFDKARDAFREGLKRPAIADRLPGIRELVDLKEIRATEDLTGAIRVQEQAIAKKRDEIERIGKENREIWKMVDEQNSQGRPLPAGATERAIARAEDLQKKLKVLTQELTNAEATRAALHDGLGRLLTSVDASVRAPKILELASAAQKAASFEDKLVFIRIFGAIRAPESRDALIEMARLSQDGQVRCAAVTALGDLEDPTTIPSLSEALKDEVWSVKTAAAQALAMIPSVDSVQALAAALGKNEGGTSDAIVKALEDITGVTFFDNGTLWSDWFTKEGQDIKAALADLESGEPTIRTAAMNILASKGTLAGVRLLLRFEGLDPPRDARAKVKPSAISAAETRTFSKEEMEARRSAIARLLQSRPKAIRDRAIPTLILEPVAHARELDDDVLEERYLRAASSLVHPGIMGMLASIADRTPSGEKAEIEERLRRSAIDGLGFQDHDEAVDILARVLRNDKASKEAKALCIASLERLKREGCVQPLIEALLEKGPVAEAAARSLKALTNQDLGLDRTAWNAWWHDKGKETAGLGKRKSIEEREEEKKEEDKKGGTTFYGIKTHSKRILYILDISGSMNEDDQKAGTGVTGGTKIQVAKKELKASIASLPEDAIFDIIIFADGLQVWKPKLMTATKDVKADVVKWVDGIRAIGATNIFDALEKAFEMAGRGTTDKRYTLTVDTILFMSDGQPNRGRIVDPGAIIAEVARLNEHKKVCIHTVGVGKGHDVELMKRLARLNGGIYVAK